MRLTHLALKALQFLPEPLVILDSEQVIQFINPAAIQFLQVSADVIGQPMSVLPSDKDYRATPMVDEFDHPIGQVMQMFEPLHDPEPVTAEPEAV
jgi:nitrogen-specific signal transduction histidine kinase